MVNDNKRKRQETEAVALMVEDVVRTQQQDFIALLNMVRVMISSQNRGWGGRAAVAYKLNDKVPAQVKRMDRLFGVTDKDCIRNLRMDRNAFGRLCMLLRGRSGLTDKRYVNVEEQVAMFLSTLAHHKKTRVVGFEFIRSGYTVSHYVHEVLRAVIHLHSVLLVKPKPIDETCDDPRWKWFKGCLGALDGTYINVRVSVADAPRYRSRKGQLSTNTLAVCDRFLRFVYVLPGWEGSVADSIFLRDAVTRPNGLKVPKGFKFQTCLELLYFNAASSLMPAFWFAGSYYLCDNGYANSEGFLTPFKGVRYHLKEWGPQHQRPSSPRELYNMRHTMARNVIERAFAVLKMRWGILRSASFYPIATQTRLIMACFLLHNYIRGEMHADPIEQELDAAAETGEAAHAVDEESAHPSDAASQNDGQFVDTIESTPEGNQMRQDLADYMWQHL